MPIVPLQSAQVPETSAVSLAAYARHIQACECAFFGVAGGPECSYAGGCRSIWTKDQRDWVQYYLAEAQYEIEEVIHFFIGKRWVVDESHFYASRMITQWGYVISGGVETHVDIAIGETVDHTADPAVIGPVATTVTDVSEIKVYHHESDIEVIPSDISISGGFVTIEVPRCRLVIPALVDNPVSGLNYTTLTNFADEVDIVRVYNVNNDPVTLVNRVCSGCSDETTPACLYVRNGKIGAVEVQATCGCAYAYKARLNYYAGRDMTNSDGTLTWWGRQAQTAIIRLAHAKMPHAPCDCSAADDMWKRDREVIVDGFGRPQRGVSPFGPEEGAWTAYIFCKAPGMALVRGALL